MTSRSRRAAPEVRCRWMFERKSASLGLTNIYRCPDCKGWTANLPLYKYSVCPKKDRRKRKQDRRA